AERLPPSSERDAVLLETEATPHSSLGAIAYEMGGVLIDHGCIRALGSGHRSLHRSLPALNICRKGFYHVADDAIGGFFAINGGELGTDLHHVYYLSPDTLGCESLGMGYSAFLSWLMTGDLAAFYDDLRWQGWESEVSALSGDQVLYSFPPLFIQT